MDLNPLNRCAAVEIGVGTWVEPSHVVGFSIKKASGHRLSPWRHFVALHRGARGRHRGDIGATFGGVFGTLRTGPSEEHEASKRSLSQSQV